MEVVGLKSLSKCSRFYLIFEGGFQQEFFCFKVNLDVLVFGDYVGIRLRRVVSIFGLFLVDPHYIQLQQQHICKQLHKPTFIPLNTPQEPTLLDLHLGSF